MQIIPNEDVSDLDLRQEKDMLWLMMAQRRLKLNIAVQLAHKTGDSARALLMFNSDCAFLSHSKKKIILDSCNTD